MRVGLVCPYSFDVPGGVQSHVRDLAEHLIGGGHEVSVLAPADTETAVPDYLAAAGRAVPVKYNGSVARLTFGPMSASRVRRWIADGDFDVLHLHEPVTPSLSILALWLATGPIVATYHTAMVRSRAMQAVQPMLRPTLEKINARIAVSDEARRTLVQHFGGDAVVIPNGVDVDAFATARINPDWRGSPDRPTIAIVGRLDEPRKGLPVLLAALPMILRVHPGLRVLALGRGQARQVLADWPPAVQRAVELLGGLDDAAKASMLRSVDLYVAPHTRGESFGIVLVEAMSAGTPVVAADLSAFRRVLEEGEYGVLVPVGDPDALAGSVISLLADPERRRRLSERASRAARHYDWSRVGAQVESVYETVRSGLPDSDGPGARVRVGTQ